MYNTIIFTPHDPLLFPSYSTDPLLFVFLLLLMMIMVTQRVFIMVACRAWVRGYLQKHRHIPSTCNPEENVSLLH